MAKKKNEWLYRALCAALVVTLTAGTAVMTPIADFVGTSITASAATYTGYVEASNLQKGDTLKAGAHLECFLYYFRILDENNNEITAKTDDWPVNKDYTIASITFDGDDLYTIHVTSATSTPKLAQVTWMDGTTLLGTSYVAEGESPVYNGKTPTNDSGTFIGWKDGNNTFYADGTALPNITADTTYTAVFEKTLAVGTEYYIGDILNTNGSKYIIPNNLYSSTYSYNISAVVPTPTYRKAENYWYFADMIRSGWGFTMADNEFSGTETVIGFRCVSGDGSSSNTAFKFDLIYENETDTCEMDFSDVETSIVSIKDADENTVALNNGKATIKTGYVITSGSPLSFPRTHAVQQTDENNFVYVIKNMIQSEKKVAYDTSAFKGTVTAYAGYNGVIVNGYEGTSVQQFSGMPYYNQSVTVDFSHGTMLTGRNDYYDAPLDEFFDIYNADGENITDLFEFSNLAGSYYNYYYYKLKQNLETDIYVFPTGTKFSLTLPEGVTIENADDVVTAQDGNKYTIRPAATAILVSDSLLSVLNSNAYLSVRPDTFKKVVNGKYVYEVKVITEYVVSKSNIITNQEQFDNAKAGDILMPAETLDVGTAGYNNLEYGEYFNIYGSYWAGSGSGISLNSDTTATIDDTLSIKINGSHKAYPVNVGKHENSSDYTVAEDMGNAWLIVRSQKEENAYWKTVELTGFNLELADYQFNWADDNHTATVTFNNGEPADADVTREADSANSQWVYTATKAYDNGIPYIETKNINGYTVKWKDENGTVLETDENVETGLKPTYDGAALTKDSTAQYNYTFAGWTSDGGTTVYTAETLPAVTKAVTYTAVFDEELITYPFTADTSLNNITLTVADHENNAVTVKDGAFDAPIGSTISASVPLTLRNC